MTNSITSTSTRSTPVSSTLVSTKMKNQFVKSTLNKKKCNISSTDTTNNQNSGSISKQESILANEPPGTVIKCITAQVIQSTQGPRIVLQGLQGSNFTAQQLQLIQQQVKQQLLKSKMIFFIFLMWVFGNKDLLSN